MNQSALLCLPALVAAATFGLTIFGASIASKRVGDLTPAPYQGDSTSDRQFLAALETDSKRISQLANEDRGFLAALDEVDALAIPRATFVAPPQAAAPVPAFRTTSSELGDQAPESAIPRATFVAPPRSDFSSSRRIAPAANRVSEQFAGTPRTAVRRSTVLVYNGRVFVARATELVGMSNPLSVGGR